MPGERRRSRLRPASFVRALALLVAAVFSVLVALAWGRGGFSLVPVYIGYVGLCVAMLLELAARAFSLVGLRDPVFAWTFLGFSTGIVAGSVFGSRASGRSRRAVRALQIGTVWVFLLLLGGWWAAHRASVAIPPPRARALTGGRPVRRPFSRHR